MTNNGTYRDSRGDKRCSACGQYVDVCKEFGCHPTEMPESHDIFADYQGPDNPNALREAEVAETEVIQTMTVAQLGLPKGATARDVLARMQELGLRPLTVDEVLGMMDEKNITHEPDYSIVVDGTRTGN